MFNSSLETEFQRLFLHSSVFLTSLWTCVQFSSVQFSHSVVSNSAALWTAARQASLSITNSRSPPKPMSIKLVMPSDHLILCCSPLLLPSIFPSIRVFSNEGPVCRPALVWALISISPMCHFTAFPYLTFSFFFF